MLFILYQRRSKRKFYLIQSSISITQHRKYGVHSRKYYCKSSHWLRPEEAEQTADCFSEQTRLCTAEEEPGEDRPAGGRRGQGIFWCKKKNVIQKNYDNKSGVEIALWWEKNLWWTKFVMKTQKHKLWQNSKTQVMTKFKNSKCDETQKQKLWQNLETQIVTKPKKIKLRYNTKTQVKTKI